MNFNRGDFQIKVGEAEADILFWTTETRLSLKEICRAVNRILYRGGNAKLMYKKPHLQQLQMIPCWLIGVHVLELGQ